MFHRKHRFPAAVQRIGYGGGSTFVGRALQFAAGMLAQEKSSYASKAHGKQGTQHDLVLGKRLQVQI
jgi:hypothetical protein